MDTQPVQRHAFVRTLLAKRTPLEELLIAASLAVVVGAVGMLVLDASMALTPIQLRGLLGPPIFVAAVALALLTFIGARLWMRETAPALAGASNSVKILP